MTIRAALVLAALGTSSSVFAQAQTAGNVTYALTYQVYAPTGPAGSPWSTAALQPGSTVNSQQGALIQLRATMSGVPGYYDPFDPEAGLGSPQTWNPSLTSIPPGSSGTGMLTGFWGGDINVIGDGGAASANGHWSNATTEYAEPVRRETRVWTAGGGNGFVNGDIAGTTEASVVTDIQPAQFNADANALNHQNARICWTGLWIPTSYSSRTVSFAAALGSLGFLTQIAAMDNYYGSGFDFPVPLNVVTHFGAAVSVQVIPVPPNLAVLLCGGIVVARRRRRR
jgi:hypothetical protein